MRKIFTLLFMVVMVLSCSTKSSQSPSDFSNSLTILSGAINVKYAKLNRTDQVSYKIIAKYPANEKITELKSEAGLKRMDTSRKRLVKSRNPDLPCKRLD